MAEIWAFGRGDSFLFFILFYLFIFFSCGADDELIFEGHHGKSKWSNSCHSSFFYFGANKALGQTVIPVGKETT